MSQDYQDHQYERLCGRHLLRTTWSERKGLLRKPHIHRPMSSWWGFNHISICWRDSTGEHKEFRRILECINGNFKTGGWGIEERACYAGPHKQWRAGWRCEDQGEVLTIVTMRWWGWGSWEEKQDKNWGYSSRLQERQLWPVGPKSAWKKPMVWGTLLEWRGV